MTDRELLELAAKAANVDVRLIKRRNTAVCEGDDYYEDLPEDRWYFVLKDFSQKWNPLTDDGDALWLAATLGIDIEWRADGRVAAYRHANANGYCSTAFESSREDRAANVRRAIVRAAAEIGRNMK